MAEDHAEMDPAGASRLEHLEEPWRAAVRLAWEAHCSGSIGVGAVLTDPAGSIIAAGRNRIRDIDAPPGRLRSTYIAHAELDVLAQLPHGDYSGHTLWTTLEPCLLCLSAVVLSHVGTVRYAAPDPLWTGIDGLPRLNAQVARRWPARHGPLGGPVAGFCALLPLAWAVQDNPDGVVAKAYALRDLALLTLARRLIGEGVLDRHRGQPVEAVLEHLRDDLATVAVGRA